MRLILCLLAIALFKAEDPPEWANKFSQNFTEKMKYFFIKGETKGSYYYNYDLMKYRMDRENGKFDRYCGSVYKLRDTPCSHYVSEGKRYLHFPEKDYCCMCCTSEKGCGILKPDWLEGATLIKEYKNKEDKDIQVWSKKGAQTNTIHVYKDTGRTWIIDMSPNDIITFDDATYNEEFNDDVFDLPKNCNPDDKCGFLTVCAAIRGESQNIELSQE